MKPACHVEKVEKEFWNKEKMQNMPFVAPIIVPLGPSSSDESSDGSISEGSASNKYNKYLFS